MTTSTLTTPQRARYDRAASAPAPAAAAALRVSRAGIAVGAFGLVTSLFVVSRVLESWRVGPAASAHTISLLGAHLSYPAANIGAIVVLALAAVGLTVTVTAATAACRELAAARCCVARLREASHNLEPLADGTRVIEGGEPDAFCAGLLRPRVYITTAAIERLDDGALRAVLAHERYHARRHDPLRLATGRVLTRALLFLPGLRRLIERQRDLAELGADEAAASGGRPALARAILAFEHTGIDPARVDFLLAGDERDPSAWRFPTALCLAAVAVTALLAAAAALAGALASGTATLDPPFLSAQPCVVVLASIPAGLALLVARGLARMRDRWRTAS